MSAGCVQWSWRYKAEGLGSRNTGVVKVSGIGGEQLEQGDGLVVGVVWLHLSRIIKQFLPYLIGG